MATAAEGREKSQITGLRDGHDILSLPSAPNHNSDLATIQAELKRKEQS
jgi:hypothetical protein